MEQPVDPQFIPLACIMIGCKPDHLLRATWAGGALTVQAENKPAAVFAAAEIAEFAADDIAGAVACGLHQRPAPGWYEAHIAPAAQRSGVAPTRELKHIVFEFDEPMPAPEQRQERAEPEEPKPPRRRRA